MEGGEKVNVNRKSTADSWNRRRDKNRVEGALHISEWGNEDTIFVDPMEPDVTLAKGYQRILYGDHGPYVEFTKAHIIWDAFPTTIRKKDYAYYDEHRTATKFVLAYDQKRHVRNKPNPPAASRWSAFNNRMDGYADYRRGLVYISADAVQVGSFCTPACRDDMVRHDATLRRKGEPRVVPSPHGNGGEAQEGAPQEPAPTETELCESKSDVSALDPMVNSQTITEKLKQSCCAALEQIAALKESPDAVPPPSARSFLEIPASDQVPIPVHLLPANLPSHSLITAEDFVSTESGTEESEGACESGASHGPDSGTEELVKQLKELLGTRSMPVSRLHSKYTSKHGVFALDNFLNHEAPASHGKPRRHLADFLSDMPRDFAVRMERCVLVAQVV